MVRARSSRTEAGTDAVCVIAALSAFANVYRKACDRPPVSILMSIHRTIIAEATHELIVVRSHRSETIVAIVGDGGSVYLEGVRALHKLPCSCNTRCGFGLGKVRKEAGARERRGC